MTARRVAISLVTLLLLASSARAADDKSSFAGIALTAQQIRFNPHYTFYDGSDPGQFDDRANGVEVRVFAGQRFRSGSRFAMAWQGMLAMNGFDWSLSLPSEPAKFRYALPYTLLASAMPEVRLGGVSVFGEVGGGVGRVHEIKTSPSSSTYDHEAFSGVLAVGAGVRLKLSERIDALAQYQYSRYHAFEYDTLDSAGAKVEHVRDAPRPRGVSFGIAARF
jgi:opacity protein-like surface antigen